MPNEQVEVSKIEKPDEIARFLGLGLKPDDYLTSGVKLSPNNDYFEVLRSGELVGRLFIRTGTVQYNDIKQNKIYFADIYPNGNNRYDSIVLKRDDLPVDIDAIAEALRQKQEIEASRRKLNSIPKNLIEVQNSTGISPVQYEYMKLLKTAESYEDVLSIVFERRNNLTLLDIGSGYGEFPLEMSRIASQLGIVSITASDKYLHFIDENKSRLEESGVEIIYLDVKHPNLKKRFDIVTLNGSQAVGPNAFVEDAIAAAVHLLAEPGLLLLRMHEASEDIEFEPRWAIPNNMVIVRLRTLSGFPDSKYAKTIKGKPASVYIIVKDTRE